MFASVVSLFLDLTRSSRLHIMLPDEPLPISDRVHEKEKEKEKEMQLSPKKSSRDVYKTVTEKK
jgi:hypothetical protein